MLYPDYVMIRHSRVLLAAISQVLFLGLAANTFAQVNSDGGHAPDLLASATPAEAAGSSAGLTHSGLEPFSGTVTPVEPVHAQSNFLSRPQESDRVVPIRKWKTLVFAQHSAALFDAWTTRAAITSGNGYERDPLLKPFAQSPAIYPATQALPLAFDFLSYRMMHSNNRYLRHTWWLPQTASAVGSIWCGSRNLRVANLGH